MPFVGGNSGFKTVRDLICFLVGLGVCVYHFATTPPPELSIPVLMFFGGIAGLPYVMRKDASARE